MEREEKLTVRLKADELATLRRAAKRLGLTKSDLARRALAFSIPVFESQKPLPGTEARRGA